MEEFAHRWMVLGGVVALLIVITIWSLWRERRRSQALQDAAARLGMSFSAEDPGLGREAFGALPLFARGHSGKFWNVARRDDELVFGYRYATERGRDRSHRRQTVGAFRLSGRLGRSDRALPRFELRPERFSDRIRGAIGRRDIDFGDDPEFSRSNHLAGPDEGAVRALFAKPLRQYFVAQPGWSVEGEGAWLLVYRHRRRVPPDDLLSFLEEARRIRSLFTDHRG